MTVVITSPVTGAAQTGLTTPTYTLVSDVAPASNGRQQAVTALGGTQTGVTTSSPSSPFTITTVRPAQLRVLQVVDPVTGQLRAVPRNVYRIITRKGVTVLTGQAPQIFVATTTLEVPAGSDAVDPANIRAALSLHMGALAQQSAGIGDTAVTGVM